MVGVIETQTPLGATVTSRLDCIDEPDSTSVTVLATTVGRDGQRWVLVEERRLAFLAVDADVAEGSEWVLSAPRRGMVT